MPSLINKIFTDKRMDNIDWLLFNVKWAVFHLFSWWKKGLQTIDHVGKRLVLGWTYGWYFLMFKRKWNWISGVMVNVIAWSGMDRGYAPQSGQIKDYEDDICCFNTKPVVFRTKCKDWWARKRDNVSEWSDMTWTLGLVFLSELALYKNPTK
jgi:hypothetical protein